MRGPSSRCLMPHCRLPVKHFLPMLAFGVLFGCGSSAPPPADPDAKALPTLQAAVLNVTPSPWPTIVRSQGSLVADEVAVVGTRVDGRVDEVHVDLGDFVKKGAPLVTLDQDVFQLEVQQAEAQLDQACSAIGHKPEDAIEDLKAQEAAPVRQEKALWNEAKANLERALRLRREKAIPIADFDRAEAEERVAEARYAAALNSVQEKIALIGVRRAELSLARQRLQDATIRAPFDGLVQRRSAAPGAYVRVGDRIVTVVRSDPLRFRGMVPERHAQGLALGQHVTLKIESVAEPRTVAITRISPSLDQLSRSLLFEAKVDNSDRALRTGLFARAEIVIDPSATAIVVPPSAVIEFAGAEKVWKIVDGVASECKVLTGARRPNGVEILEGVQEGDVLLSDASRGQVAYVEAINDPLASEQESVVATDAANQNDDQPSEDGSNDAEERASGAVAAQPDEDAVEAAEPPKQTNSNGVSG